MTARYEDEAQAVILDWSRILRKDLYLLTYSLISYYIILTYLLT